MFYENNGKLRVVTSPMDSVEAITFSETVPSANGNFLPDSLVYTSHSGRVQKVALDDYQAIEFSPNLPEVRIVTDPYVYDIRDKVTWYDAKIIFRDYTGQYADLDSTSFQLRGRGNNSLGYDKKPYRLKFPKKTSVAGMKKAKNYCLIAGFTDKSLMQNAAALKIARMLELPYTNHDIPCNVWLNDRYCGSYFLTEKVGINSGSVDIDELTGILWEIDWYFDEDFRFRSPVYDLPVMVKDPDFEEIAVELNAILESGDSEAIQSHRLLSKMNLENKAAVTPADIFEFWEADFNSMEEAVEKGNLADVFDMDDLANYILVNLMLGNRELQHPKSNFLYKATPEDKYHMGPVWDFDWATKLNGPADYRLFGDARQGEIFYKIIVSQPEFLEVFAQKWEHFYNDLYPELMTYLDEYAKKIRVSAYQNGELYPKELTDKYYNFGSTETFDENWAELRTWLVTRANKINQLKDSTFLLFVR